MDLIMKRASALTAEEKTSLGITGIPADWPVEMFPYTGTVPAGYEQITEEGVAALKANNQAAYDAWLSALRPIIQEPPPGPQEVTTQMEKNDKTLKSVYCFGITDANGVAEARYPIPADGRWLAYGDATFKNRHFFDRITGIWSRDDDRLIATGIGTGMGLGRALTVEEMLGIKAFVGAALDMGRDATTEELNSMLGAGNWDFPRYPILGGYEDHDLAAAPALYDGGPPCWGPGMSMTFMFGNTEVGPVGGYAYAVGSFWFVIQAQKGEDCPVNERAGHWLAVSVDGAKKDT